MKWVQPFLIAGKREKEKGKISCHEFLVLPSPFVIERSSLWEWMVEIIRGLQENSEEEYFTITGNWALKGDEISSTKQMRLFWENMVDR